MKLISLLMTYFVLLCVLRRRSSCFELSSFIVFFLNPALASSPSLHPLFRAAVLAASALRVALKVNYRRGFLFCGAESLRSAYSCSEEMVERRGGGAG